MQKSLICAIALTTLAVTALSNPVQNGDFENNSDGMGDGWNYTKTEFLQVAKENNGNSYLKYVKGKPEYFDTTQLVDLSGSPETIMLKARMRLKGFVRDSAQRWKCPMVDVAFVQADGSTKLGKGIHLTSDSGDEWFSMYRLIDVPRGSQQVKLTLVNDAAAGEVDFDDIEIIKDPEDKMLSLDIINTAGSFEARTEDDTVIFGWRARVAGKIALQENGDNFCLRLQGERGRTTLADTILRLDPAWKKLRVKCRMKSELLEVGFSPTHTVKLVMEFVDADEKKMDKWITPLQLRRDTPEWTEMKSEFTVPDGAKGLRIVPTVQQCDGTGFFDDIEVEIVE